ncbi:MAG TPA: hypothetical protein VKA34_08250 [Balneolales bacterium]|nr:hypothetical protein [Balneolales bacterium]
MKANSWIIGIIGLWLIVSALIGFTPLFILWSNIISGAIIAIAGFTFIKNKPEFGWIAGILGIWIFISAFIPGLHTAPGLLWNGILAGAIVAIDGFFSLGGETGGKTGGQTTQPAH